MARNKKAGGNVVIENKRPCAIFLPGCGAHRRKMLVPGQNDVSADHMTALTGNKAVRQYLALGWLVSHGEGKAKPLPRGLDGMSEGAAVDKLGKINDPALVQDLRDRTESKPLQELAQIRLRELIGADDEPEAVEG